MIFYGRSKVEVVKLFEEKEKTKGSIDISTAQYVRIPMTSEHCKDRPFLQHGKSIANCWIAIAIVSVVFHSFVVAIPTLAGSQANTKIGLATDDNSATQLEGKLGHELGHVFRVEFQVIQNEHNKLSDSDDEYRALITKVNDNELSTPVIMDFTVDPYFGRTIDLRPSFEEIIERKNTKPGIVFDRETLKEEYLGKTFQLLAYESRRFHGFPRYPTDLQPVFVPASRSFGYSGQLVLIEPREVTRGGDQEIEQREIELLTDSLALNDGIIKGKLIVQIQLLQEILRDKAEVLNEKALLKSSDEELQIVLHDLKKRLLSRK